VETFHPASFLKFVPGAPQMRQQHTVVLSFILVTISLAAQEVVIPNDPYFRYQISLQDPDGTISINTHSTRPSSQTYSTKSGIGLDITKAWAITTGSKQVVVALLDDGFCYNHPDIKDNIWHNPGESGKDPANFDKETNGIDDDKNGYIDDVIGWDFVFNSPDPNCYSFDGMDRTRIAPYWHSTHAMGIIGAKGNNGIGVAGINWNVSMMLLKIGEQGLRRDEIDNDRIDRVVKAIMYASDNGARIINWSGFVTDTRPEKLAELRKAFAYAAQKNVLIIVGAGNDLRDLDDDANCGHAPQCFEDGNLIKVAEVDFRGELYRVPKGSKWIGGSNYGAHRVQIAAIAMNYTTGIQDGMGTYELSGGTSNAAPVVTGVAALMLSVNPNLTAVQIKNILLKTARKLPGLKGKIGSGGVVDAYKAVLEAKVSAVAPPNH
jgi:subtilisin family serine protease